ncbi:glutamine--fructose-6-phosphate aminotransferase, partial [Halorubrum sp. SS5]
MCGITGYIGDGIALDDDAEGAAGDGGVAGVGDIVHEGLRNLEYRGYDSAGVALVGETSGLTVAKRSGEVDNLTVPDV